MQSGNSPRSFGQRSLDELDVGQLCYDQAENLVYLSIIIVSYNCRSLLEQCLRSISESQTKYRFEIIIIDNQSTDDTRAMLSARYPLIHLIALRENIGFARANNLGFRTAAGRYILLLNPDTVLPEQSTLDKLVSFLETRDDIAAAGCRLVFPDYSYQVGDAGYRPTLRRTFCFALGLSSIFPNWFRGLFLADHLLLRKEWIEVDWISGACFLLRREVIDAVGGLDESFFMYGEDAEWGCRITEAGLTIAYIPTISVIHVQGGTQYHDGHRVFSTKWLDGLSRLYKQLNGDGSWRWFKLVMAAGFFLRATAYYTGFLITRKTADRNKARAMAAYGRYMCTLPERTPPG